MEGLAPFRAEIDAIDRELVALLARRLAVITHVKAYKEKHDIPALLPDRVEEVIRNVRTKAVADGIPPDLAEAIWRPMIAWFVAFEEGRAA